MEEGRREGGKEEEGGGRRRKEEGKGRTGGRGKEGGGKRKKGMEERREEEARRSREKGGAAWPGWYPLSLLGYPGLHPGRQSHIQDETSIPLSTKTRFGLINVSHSQTVCI